MKILALAAVLFALAVSQPHPRCAAPKQWEGIAVVLEPKLGDFLENDVSYDYTDQKLRYMERFFYNSSKPVTEVFEQIFDYNEKILYQINVIAKTCQKLPLEGPFQQIEIPTSAHYLAELWIGVEGLIGSGFQTELWVGNTPAGRYTGLWSQVGCIPVMDTITNPQSGYTHVTVYNVTLGIKDPNVFNPPSYC